jgi:hypothetical protein
MTVGLSSTIANSILNALCSATAWTLPVAFYVKLHTGDPGAAGTANAAGNTTRHSTTFASSSAGSKTTSADVTWTSVSTAETYTHVSFWDAVTAGNFLGSDNLAAPETVAVGSTFTIPAGSLTLALSPIAA